MWPYNLMEGDYSSTAVENKMGVGFGVKSRIQIAGSWGFIVNVSINDLQVDDSSLSTATVFTGGFYYTRKSVPGNITVDLGYGVISVADLSSTLILPSVEFSRPISDRLSISAEIGFPVANDWFHTFGIKESYGSIVFSLGGTLVF